MEFAAFLDRLRHLKRARVGGVEMPYKPLLVAAVVLLVHKRKIPTPDVMLDGGLRSAFAQLLAALYPRWPYRTKVEYPFRHLESDGVWSLVPLEGASAAFRAAKETHAEAWHVLRHVACARLPAAVFERLSTQFEDRVHALQALWESCFPPDAALKLMRFMTAEEDATIEVETRRDHRPADLLAVPAPLLRHPRWKKTFPRVRVPPCSSRCGIGYCQQSWHPERSEPGKW